MANTHKLSEITDMPEEKFQECITRLDVKTFIENPTQAMINAGITLKEGFTFKFVETEKEANALPSNVIPIKLTQKNKEPLVAVA